MKKKVLNIIAIIISLLILGIVSLVIIHLLSTGKPKEYSVNFIDLKTVTIKDGEKLELPTPEKEGYIFLGWYEENSDIKIDDDYKVVKDMVLYPKWEIEKALEIHFIKADGYYDDAILIRSSRATIFMDGGRGYNNVIKYLEELGVTDIDYIIGSHTEYDHIDAEALIIEKFNVKKVIYPNDIYNCGCRCDNLDVGKVKSALDKKNIKAEVQSIPSKLEIGDMNLYFLAPFALYCNKNNNSFVFILEFYNNKFMFTGDADSAMHNPKKLTENAQKLGLEDIQVDVVKYPHHGNENLDDSFLNTSKAKYFIVPNSSFPRFPSSSNLTKLKNKNITVYRQSDSKTGNILITSDGDDIKFIMDVEASEYKK